MICGHFKIGYTFTIGMRINFTYSDTSFKNTRILHFQYSKMFLNLNSYIRILRGQVTGIRKRNLYAFPILPTRAKTQFNYRLLKNLGFCWQEPKCKFPKSLEGQKLNSTVVFPRMLFFLNSWLKVILARQYNWKQFFSFFTISHRQTTVIWMPHFPVRIPYKIYRV